MSHVSLRMFGHAAKGQAIAHALGNYFRLLSDEQVGKYWFADARDPIFAARATMRRLEAQGHVHLFTAMVGPELSLETPVVDWRPGQEPPLFGRVAYRLKQRWQAPPRRMLIARGSERQRTLWGCPLGGRPPRPHEVAHDLALATVFFRLLEADGGLPERWRPEDALVQRTAFQPGDHIPDAVLLGDPQQVIEFGGEYSARKLSALHRAYEHGPYQIW